MLEEFPSNDFSGDLPILGRAVTSKHSQVGALTLGLSLSCGERSWHFGAQRYQ